MTFLQWSANNHAINPIKNQGNYFCEWLLIKMGAGSECWPTPLLPTCTVRSLDLQEWRRKISAVSTLTITALFVEVPALGAEQLFEN